jgi:hypothetical protein
MDFIGYNEGFTSTKGLSEWEARLSGWICWDTRPARDHVNLAEIAQSTPAMQPKGATPPRRQHFCKSNGNEASIRVKLAPASKALREARVNHRTFLAGD